MCQQPEDTIQLCSTLVWARVTGNAVALLWWLLQRCPLASLQGNCGPQPFLNCGSKNHFSAAALRQMPHVRASLGKTASLQHMSSFRPPALGAAWSVATSTGHSQEPSKRWRFLPAVPIPSHWHKNIPMNPRVLHSSEMCRQDDH